MARLALAAIVMLVVVGSSAAAPPRTVVLHDGQTAYFLPGEKLVVRCVVNGITLGVSLPKQSSAGSSTGSDLRSRKGGASVSTDTRSNGATEVRCGSATAGGGFFGRTPNRYVIGKNGLALIRGINRFAALEGVYGRARTIASGTGCRASWPSIGLVTTFTGRCTAGARLTGAVVEGTRWGTLSGVDVGDATAKMVWEAQGAKSLSGGRWLLASGGTSHHARLVAVTSVGAVVRLVLSGA
jgi:hypothetical protein